jgi:hypothetical protein
LAFIPSFKPSLGRHSTSARCCRPFVQCDIVKLNKVRNNVFHGIKIYDDRDDVRVLKLVNPILREILQACEPDIDD